MPEEQHEIEVVSGRASSYRADGKESGVLIWQALCKCGWAGAPMLNEIAALNDGDDHRVAISR